MAGSGRGILVRRFASAAVGLACAVSTVAVPAQAQVVGIDDRTPAGECCLVLLLPVGARSVALGRALTAATSPDAMFSNPAGLAGVEGSHLLIHHTDMAAQGNAFSFLANPGGVATLGLSYELVDIDEMEHTDESGQTIGVVTLRHHVLVASAASVLARGVSAGLNYKLYQFRIGCRGTCDGEQVTATTHAVDFGVLFHPSWLPALRLGAAVMNVGFPLQVINAHQADPLPVRARVGGAYEVLHHLTSVEGIELWWAVDIVDDWQDPGAPTVSSGIELAIGRTIFLRSGYVPGEGVGTGAAIGLGIDYDRFTMSIARSFASSPLEAVEEPMQFSFGFRF